MTNFEELEEFHSQLRALGCAFSYTDNNHHLTIIRVTPIKGRNGTALSNQDYNSLVNLVKSYYPSAKVVDFDDDEATKFKLE